MSRRSRKKQQIERKPHPFLADVKPIETRYKECRFRSRLEARWAVYFDALGFMWEYEKQGFKLDNGTCYLCDFWLPEHEMWAEVKPASFSPDELEKCELLVKGTRHPCALLEGLPDVEQLPVVILAGSLKRRESIRIARYNGGAGRKDTFMKALAKCNECLPFENLVNGDHGGWFELICAANGFIQAYWSGLDPRYRSFLLNHIPPRYKGKLLANNNLLRFFIDVQERMIPEAVKAAKSARFEFGEAGDVR